MCPLRMGAAVSNPISVTHCKGGSFSFCLRCRSLAKRRHPHQRQPNFFSVALILLATGGQSQSLVERRRLHIEQVDAPVSTGVPAGRDKPGIDQSHD